jgi:transposase
VTTTKDVFMINDATWRVIEPLLSGGHSGPQRVCDRRVISGIAYALMTGCSWSALPRDYGPPTTIYNRYVRWQDRRVWRKIIQAIEDAGTAPDVARALAAGRSSRRRAAA